MEKIEDLKYEFNQEIMIRTVGDTTLAYNPVNGDMYELNDVGAEILYLLKENMSIEKIFEKMSEKYKVTKDEIYGDINELVIRMLSLEIIRADSTI